VGRFDVDGSGLGYVVPFDRRLVADVQIPTGESSSAEPGDMVVVTVTRWPTATRGAAGTVSEVLGRIDQPGVDTQIIIRKYGIPDAHPPDAVAEAQAIGGAVREQDIKGRTDFRPVTTVTIK
jgi:ribonuclease R